MKADIWEAAIGRLADQAALHRGVALSAATAHVSAVAEIVRARVHERGSGDIDAEVRAHVEALRRDLNACLDRLIASRPGS
ncbi:hypothetical protein NE235_10595 [Actinoallomurus spadix]|uniref:Uncharacterized protein n=1 Tax=Actinoallomurus spadix TaxID=79912 RepID=A0ABN0WVK0_9ACTN|nr:hypothetical protein [Actinoallomurus spadix]MCO5986550.1 hypothetical protein [Actinoallomurus spadix]